MISRRDVLAARERIAPHVRRTPLLTDGPVTFKLEHLQVTGVFKARGAFNRLLAAREDGEATGHGVVIASGGNAGLATAYAARALGLPATVFVPGPAPEAKVARLIAYGARVHRVGVEYADAAAAAALFAEETGALTSHAYDHPAVVAGAGTVGEEIVEDDPGVTTVLVSTGGGGLVGGIAAALEGRVRVVAVEPRGSRALHAALEAGGPVDVPVAGVAADSLGARRVGEIAYAVAVRSGVTSVLVDDEAIIAARQALWDDYRIAAEYGAATAYAALLGGAHSPAAGERTCVLVCGANTDLRSLA